MVEEMERYRRKKEERVNVKPPLIPFILVSVPFSPENTEAWRALVSGPRCEARD